MFCDYPEDIQSPLCVLPPLVFRGLFSLIFILGTANCSPPDITLLSLALRMNWIAVDCHVALQYSGVSAVGIQIRGCDW